MPNEKLERSQLLFELLKPHIEYIFIDESGDLGKYGSVYFTIVALSTHLPNEISRIFKRLRERKFKKKHAKLPEIKAYNSNEEIRRYVLGRLSLCDCSISAVVISKSKIGQEFFEENNTLYNHLCGILFEHISLNTDIVDITIDRKHGNRMLREDFDQYIERKIMGKNPDLKVSIRHLESFASNELQAVDFVAWAVNRKFTHGDSAYYDIIGPKIRNQGKEEIWKD